MTAVRVEEVTTPQACLERTGREWWRLFGRSGNWRRWRCARGVACPVWVVHEGVNGRKGDCPRAIVDPVMEEQVRRRSNDRKHTKINRKRRSPQWGVAPALPDPPVHVTKARLLNLSFPVMEEKVRRRPNDRKPTKINRERRGPQWGVAPALPDPPVHNVVAHT
jgi:hypothetical protein